MTSPVLKLVLRFLKAERHRSFSAIAHLNSFLRKTLWRKAVIIFINIKHRKSFEATLNEPHWMHWIRSTFLSSAKFQVGTRNDGSRLSQARLLIGLSCIKHVGVGSRVNAAIEHCNVWHICKHSLTDSTCISAWKCTCKFAISRPKNVKLPFAHPTTKSNSLFKRSAVFCDNRIMCLQ